MEEAAARTGVSRLRRLFDFRAMRFLFVGGLNSLFGFAVFSLLAWVGASTWLALLGSNVAGIVFNFFTIGGVVFRDLGMRRAPRFAMAYLCLFWINLECIHLLSGMIQIDRIRAQALLVAPMAILSYLIMSKLVFAPRSGMTARVERIDSANGDDSAPRTDADQGRAP